MAFAQTSTQQLCGKDIKHCETSKNLLHEKAQTITFVITIKLNFIQFWFNLVKQF